MARWLLLLSEFDITHVTQKYVKGRTIAEKLAESPREESQPFKPMFPDEEIMMVEDDYPKMGWTLYFDGAANKTGQGVGALLVSPRNEQLPLAVKLQFDCTNIMAEYGACIVGLDAALALGIEDLDVYGDSNSIICQTQGEWKTREEKLQPYHEYLDVLTHTNLMHVPRIELHCLTSPWLFSVWGVDIIGKISPKSSNGHKYTLVAIDYFAKWVEAASYAKFTSASVAKFIRTNIICRYEIPHELISDNGSHFKKEKPLPLEEVNMVKEIAESPETPVIWQHSNAS
ncbi:uncharacterized protein LOC143855988 [Tasmannia lanceolata]|uniref:uncharacterized protein LOC143855988 n=1 Tax=Tasmannia lanceolata TaxID=3420 RepID=UPI004063EFC5